MTATATPEVLYQRTLPELVNQWTQDLCEALEENYVRSYPNSDHILEFIFEEGRKYYKIKSYDVKKTERLEDRQVISNGVHAFVDKKTGEVYKPASWRGPAKGVRYDLRVINERHACLSNADWAGGYLYQR